MYTVNMYVYVYGGGKKTVITRGLLRRLIADSAFALLMTTLNPFDPLNDIQK